MCLACFIELINIANYQVKETLHSNHATWESGWGNLKLIFSYDIRDISAYQVLKSCLFTDLNRNDHKTLSSNARVNWLSIVKAMEVTQAWIIDSVLSSVTGC